MITCPLDYPQVAQSFMNHDHADFVQRRGEILDRLELATTSAAVDTLLAALLEHTVKHFAEEEALMRECGFPPYEIHKQEHDRVIAEMKAQASAWQQRRDTAALRDWLEHAVGDWFANHVSTMDRMTALFAAERGIRR